MRIYSTLGASLKAARDQRQWSQVCLSNLTGISVSRLSALETERRHPSPNEWEKLRQSLPLGCYEPAVELPAAPRKFHTAPPAIERAERSFAQRFPATRGRFGPWADRIMMGIKARQDAAACLKFLQLSRSDSALESWLWMRLLAEGAMACCFSPLRAGFRRLPVIHGQTYQNIGDLRLPCLTLATHDRSAMLFPQVTVQTTRGYYRLDALVGVWVGRDRLWLDLEVDGEGHVGELDLRRQGHLGLEAVRLTPRDLRESQLVPHLWPRFTALLGQPQAV